MSVLAFSQHKTFLAHAGAGCAELACTGTSGPPALTSRLPRRAGPGWTARATLSGWGLPESGGPRWSLLSVPR